MVGHGREAVKERPAAVKPSGRPSLSAVATALATLIFLAWSGRFLAHASMRAIDGRRYFALFDDALISMRYAWNLSHGHGLVWNPGERVEGYSNLLTTLVMALATALFDRRLAALAIQALGVATVLLAAGLARGLARLATANDPETVRRALPPIAFAATLSIYPLAYWSFMGMETGLMTVLLLAALVAVERWAKGGDRGALIAIPLACGLASLGRPDGILFAALVLPAFAHAALGRVDPARARALTLGLVALTLVFPAAQLAFRLAYYGAALPNTYVLKLEGFPLGVRVANGIAFLAPLLPQIGVLTLVTLVALVRRPDRAGAVAPAALVALAAYQIAVGGDPWRYWRIVTPALPLALIMGARAALRTCEAARALPRPAGVVLATVATAAMTLWLDAAFLPEMTGARRAYQYEANRDHVNAALALDSLTTPTARVGVFWAGGIPYYTMRPAADFLGKTDPHVARLAPDLSGAISWNGMSTIPGHNKYDLEWSIRHNQPDYVEGFAWGRQDLSRWAEQHYDSVTFHGVGLRLLRGSKAVRWERIEHRIARGDGAGDLDSVSAIP
jgi:arabinofuranosyltransferase